MIMSIRSKKLKLKYWMLPCQERFKFGTGDLVVCTTVYFIPVMIRGACAIMRVSAVPGKLMLLAGKDTLKVLEARFDLKKKFGIFPVLEIVIAKCCESVVRGHLRVPWLPDSSWEVHDPFVPSETAGPLGFFDQRDE